MINRILTPMLVSLLLIGCQEELVKQEDVADDIQAALEQQSTEEPAEVAAPELPPDVAQSLLPPVNVVLPQVSAPPEPRFDIAVNESPAREFFMSLVADTPHNMVVHPAVQGNISLTLKNVTIDEVMETVRNVYGLEYSRNATGYMVLPTRLRTRTFHIDYLNLKRTGTSKTWVNSGQLSQRETSGEDTTSGTTTTEEETSGSSVETITESDFWSELQGSLQAIIAATPGGSVVLSPQAGLAVVRALPDDLRTVEEFLRVMHANLNRQVVIEAKIIEVTLSDGFQSGVNWAALADLGNNNKQVLIGQTGGGTFFSDGASESAGNSGALDPDNLNQVVGTAASAFGGVFTTAINLGDFTAFIELLKSQGNVQVLSSPRVSTVNNQKAVIKVGSDEFFVTDISSTTTTGTATTTTPNITLTPFFSGIALDVTPHIDERNRIILHIHPSISEVTDQTKRITVAGQDQSLPLALSTVRESDSIVQAHSGQIVAIGGLMKNFTRKDQAGVPLLGDLPLVGGAFRHDRNSGSKSELVILLRPLVVGDNRAWAEHIQDAANRVNSMRRELDASNSSKTVQ